MIRTVFPIMAAAAAVAATGAQAADIQIASQGPVVELNVTESVDAEPDLVTIGAGVTTNARTAVEAMRLNAVEMTKVIEQIKAQGVPEKDIQTSGISLGARYEYDQRTQKQVFQGYQVSNRVSVKLRDIDDTGKVLDALVVAGATDLDGPNFSLENDEPAKAAARKSAMERAKSQALEYARLAGYANVRLLEVSETMSGYGGSMPKMRSVALEAAPAPSAPVQPGQVSTAVNITVKYEMTR